MTFKTLLLLLISYISLVNSNLSFDLKFKLGSKTKILFPFTNVFMSVKDFDKPGKYETMAIDSIERYTGYNLTRFDDKICFKIIDEHYSEYSFVKEFKVGVMISDFCRYLMVYHYGVMLCLQRIQKTGCK